MKDFMRTIALGAVIMTALVAVGYHSTRDRSTIEFINGSDHKITVVAVSEDVGMNTAVAITVRSNTNTHISLKNGRYMLFYRADIERDHSETNIKLTEDTRYKFTDGPGGLVFNDKPK